MLHQFLNFCTLQCFGLVRSARVMDHMDHMDHHHHHGNMDGQGAGIGGMRHRGRGIGLQNVMIY